MEKKKIKILVVDNHPFMREGIKTFLARHKRYVVVGEASNGQEAIGKTRQMAPDVVLMELNMPVMSGLEATRRLQKSAPRASVLVLTQHEEKNHILEIIQAGARGYVLKDGEMEELLQGLEAIGRGETFFSARVSNILLNEYMAEYGRTDRESAPEVSPREREVLIMIAEGCSNKEIAARLFISVRTVETHRERIMRKLGLRNAAGLTKYAISKGLIRLKENE